MLHGKEIILNEICQILLNKTIGEIINFEKDNIFNKSGVTNLIRRYIDLVCSFSNNNLEEYGIYTKIVPVNDEYRCYESMSFSNQSLYNILFEKWDSEDEFEVATLKTLLKRTYLFIPIIKRKYKNNFNHYNEWQIGNVSIWEPNRNELELIGKEWNYIKHRISKGVIVKQVPYGKYFRNENNLPKQSETKFIHLRPHGKNSLDIDIPYFDYTNQRVEITKQSFWLNKCFINDLLKKNKWKMNLKDE